MALELERYLKFVHYINLNNVLEQFLKCHILSGAIYTSYFSLTFPGRIRILLCNGTDTLFFSWCALVYKTKLFLNLLM